MNSINYDTVIAFISNAKTSSISIYESIETLNIYNTISAFILLLFVIVFMLNKRNKSNISKSYIKGKKKAYEERRKEEKEKRRKEILQIRKEEIEKRNNERKEKERKEERNKIGEEYERNVGKHYESKGYKVEYRGIDLKELDGGIDLIATKDKEILLIQCKKWGKEESIKHQMIKEFYGNCHFYLDENYKLWGTYNILCIYAVHKKSVFDKSAEFTFVKNYNKCRYEIVKDI